MPYVCRPFCVICPPLPHGLDNFRCLTVDTCRRTSPTHSTGHASRSTDYFEPIWCCTCSLIVQSFIQQRVLGVCQCWSAPNYCSSAPCRPLQPTAKSSQALEQINSTELLKLMHDSYATLLKGPESTGDNSWHQRALKITTLTKQHTTMALCK